MFISNIVLDDSERKLLFHGMKHVAMKHQNAGLYFQNQIIQVISQTSSGKQVFSAIRFFYEYILFASRNIYSVYLLYTMRIDVMQNIFSYFTLFIQTNWFFLIKI